MQCTVQSGNRTKLLNLKFLNIRESLFPLVEIIFNFDSLELYSNMLCFGNCKAMYGMFCRGESRRRLGRKDCDGPFVHLFSGIPSVIDLCES